VSLERGPLEPSPPASLLEAQSFLLEALRSPRSVVDDARDEAAARFVTGNDRLTPAEQVDVYRRQFWLRHEDSLLEDFPALRAILGEATWDRFVVDYLGRFPPHTSNLRDLGAEVVEFLEAWADLDPALRELAIDAARYELAFVDVFDGPDPSPFPSEKLTRLPPEDIARARLRIHPGIRLIEACAPVHAFRKALRAQGQAPGELAPSAESLERRPTYVALFRKDLVVHFETLTRPAFLLLQSLAEGAALADACERVSAALDDEGRSELGRDIGGWFERWGAWGFITDLDVE
jgi:hypothetical protein